MIAGKFSDINDDEEASRSAGLVSPGQSTDRKVIWYICQDASCHYRERARYDGSLTNEFCPRDGSLLVRETPVPESD